MADATLCWRGISAGSARCRGIHQRPHHLSRGTDARGHRQTRDSTHRWRSVQAASWTDFCPQNGIRT
jgi:hypothetical protein